MNIKELNNILESLDGYETVAKIIQNDKGFNVAEKNEPMLTKDVPSLKTLLKQLAEYM